MSRRSVAEAKAQFAACLREAERGEPVTILRHGKPAAVLVSWSEWERRQSVAGDASAGSALEGHGLRLCRVLYEARSA